LYNVSRTLYCIAIPRLYTTINIKLQDRIYWEGGLNIIYFLQILSESPEYLQYIKNIYIGILIWQKVEYRYCYNTEYKDNKDNKNNKYNKYNNNKDKNIAIQDPIIDLGVCLLFLFSQLRDNSLNNF
jgi:hypothetical protein